MAITRATLALWESAGQNNGSGATTAFAATTGNAIVVFIRTSNSNSPTITSVTDTALNTYSLVTSNTAGDPWMWCYRAKNITGHATNVVTVTFGSANANYAWAGAVQYAGVDPLPDDVVDQKNGSGLSNIASNTFSTAVPNEVIVVAAAQNAGTTLTAGANFTEVDLSISANGAANQGGIEEYITTSSLTTYAAHITGDGGFNYTILTMSFKPLAAGGGTLDWVPQGRTVAGKPAGVVSSGFTPPVVGS